jgi:hypothetical protein
MYLIQIKHTQIKIPLWSFWTVYTVHHSLNADYNLIKSTQLKETIICFNHVTRYLLTAIQSPQTADCKLDDIWIAYVYLFCWPEMINKQ